MADNDVAAQRAIQPVERPLNLIPVGLKEAALDSPTFRATAAHFSEQVDAVERWLEGYVRATQKLSSEIAQFETAINGFLGQTTPPPGLSEAVIDHDYTLLSVKRFGEGAREVWSQTLKTAKRYDSAVAAPIRSFLSGDLRTFKETRRALEASQKGFDNLLARYLGQSKMKEASALREDAFHMHEARKAYLKASMDFSVAGPQVKDVLDKLIVKIFTEQWRDLRMSRDASSAVISRFNGEMERVRGWSTEMGNSERAFRRELHEARKQIEDSASQMIKPSRELADYETSTVAYLGSGPTATKSTSSPAQVVLQERGEKQGWLFMKTAVGKPARTVWSRRWFFVKNGIFGWLVQGTRTGGVEESEKIGVLLCGVKPAFQEERRFCLEVKTHDTSIVLQAETQAELSDWIAAFEIAKKKALEDPTRVETSPLSPGVDPAFAITPPISSEFAARPADAGAGDEIPGVLSLSERETSGITARASFDVGAAARRVASIERDPESSRDHASRIIQKLDLHKKSASSVQTSQPAAPMGGGIASLITASHNIFPVGPGVPQPDAGRRSITNPPPSSLAPSTLANPPAPTSLSHTAVLVSSERGITLGGRTDDSGMPGGIMANLWGSSNWSYVNRLGDEPKSEARSVTRPNFPSILSGSVDDVGVMDGEAISDRPASSSADDQLGSPRHRKTVSAVAVSDVALPGQTKPTQEVEDVFPNYYPLALKAQHAQFRILFPSVPPSEKLVLVFRATWNPNEQQEFPGRVYVTEKEIYFYSHHLGLVLITNVSLASVAEVTAAPGRDCDFLYLLLKADNRQDERNRVTVRVFLDAMKLLQRRLSYLVENANSPEPDSLENVIKALIKMEAEEPLRSSSADSWEDLTYDANDVRARDDARRRQQNIKTSLRIDGSLYNEASKTGREVQRFQLPRKPVVYAPQGMHLSVTREFNVSAKGLFHVMFGDKSAVFQLLYANRWADKVLQSPWIRQPPGPEGRWNRQLASQGSNTPMADSQTIDIMNDHLCYVVTHHKRPWRLPYSERFTLTTKIVITHTSKSRCKLAIFQAVSWHQSPTLIYLRDIVERQALNNLEADALDLTTVAMDQVAKLGSQSKTNKAVEIFGAIGAQGAVTQFDASAISNTGSSAVIFRTKAAVPVGLGRLAAADLVARFMGLFWTFMDLFAAVGKGVAGICNAHTLLVILLSLSALYNSWYSYRDSVTWWHERQAGNFMARLGVKPAPTLSRAVYLADIEDMARPTLENETFAALGWPSDSKTCRTTFGDMLASPPDLAPELSAGGRKLHRSRDAFARYRHDLLVAMRVVNRMERDIVHAEWVEWVQHEEGNCRRVERMLLARRRSSSVSGHSSAAEVSPAELDHELGPEFEEYCASCRRELAGLGTETALL